MGRFCEVFFNWLSIAVLLICIYVCITHFVCDYYSNTTLAFWGSLAIYNILIDSLHYFYDPGRITK